MGTITIKNLIGGSINIVTKSEPEKYMGPLCFTAQEDNATVGMTVSFGNITASLQISTDEQKTWTQWDGSVVNLNSECENGKLYVKALNPNTNGFFDSRNYKGHNFVINNGKVAASGNIQYLLDPTGERMDVPNYCYSRMFRSCTSLTTAPELPATTLASNCYLYMFYGCKSLTQAPELPATTLAPHCYTNMFQDCTSLTKAPELPATTAYNGCYNGMFSGCTSLTQAPELPATTLADSCYQSMFYGCTSLTNAPELPATTLVSNCYDYMFQNCTSLTSAPVLPATTLADTCYQGMFSNCTSLTTAPELPATTLANSCYEEMFYGCPLFSTVKMKASMNGIYNTSIHGDIKKTVEYVL